MEQIGNRQMFQDLCLRTVLLGASKSVSPPGIYRTTGEPASLTYI